MYIYADESGHSGRHIFNEPLFYFQGAIISEVDTESILAEVAEKYRVELGVNRLHANEIRPHVVERIASSFLRLLENTNWVFHVTAVEKPYLATTKFVDSLFDSGENKGARWLWYNHEYFRHTLCCLFDELLTNKDKKNFWQSYLSDDFDGIATIAKVILNRLGQIRLDKRLYQVSSEGLKFALKYPNEITLMASKGKKSYKGHTPNMVAFSSLIQAAHQFYKKNETKPILFAHDLQSEFGSTMKEIHETFANIRTEVNDSGFSLQVEKVDYGLGNFELTNSKCSSSLQAVDIFLWLNQRKDNIKSAGLKTYLSKVTETFYISRPSSELIVMAWAHRLYSKDFTDEQIEEGRKIMEDMEATHLRQLHEFEENK